MARFFVAIVAAHHTATTRDQHTRNNSFDAVANNSGRSLFAHKSGHFFTPICEKLTRPHTFHSIKSPVTAGR
jgi:hypothetical protein